MSLSLQKSIDLVHIAFSRLHSYATQRISNRYKQPDKFLLREKARQIRSHLERINRSILIWSDSGFTQLSSPDFAIYISDLAAIIRLIPHESNLRQMNVKVLEALQALYDELIEFIPIGYSVQLSLFLASDTFHEEVKESKLIHKVMIDFEWVPVLACVSKLLRAFSEKVIIYPASLICPKSSWRSGFSFVQPFIFQV